MRISDWSSDVCSSDLQDLIQADPVGHDRPQPAVGFQGQPDTALARAPSDQALADVQDLVNCGHLFAKSQNARIDLGEVEYVVDEVEEMQAGAMDVVHVLSLLRIE